MFGLGPSEIVVLLVILLLLVWPSWKVCAKAGFPGALGLLVLPPGGIIVLLLVLALVEWPALRRVAGPREAGA